MSYFIHYGHVYVHEDGKARAPVMERVFTIQTKKGYLRVPKVFFQPWNYQEPRAKIIEEHFFRYPSAGRWIPLRDWLEWARNATHQLRAEVRDGPVDLAIDKRCECGRCEHARRFETVVVPEEPDAKGRDARQRPSKSHGRSARVGTGDPRVRTAVQSGFDF